jgi:hypothetical protein
MLDLLAESVIIILHLVSSYSCDWMNASRNPLSEVVQNDQYKHRLIFGTVT